MRSFLLLRYVSKGIFLPKRRVLTADITAGPEANDIEIVSNECINRGSKKKEEEGGWEIQFHDDSGFGHDKSLTIRPYAKHFEERPNEPRPTLFYAGDGVSDLSAARETDLLFAKKGHGRHREQVVVFKTLT